MRLKTTTQVVNDSLKNVTFCTTIALLYLIFLSLQEKNWKIKKREDSTKDNTLVLSLLSICLFSFKSLIVP